VEKMSTLNDRSQITSLPQASDERVGSETLSSKLKKSPVVSTIIRGDSLVVCSLLSNSMPYVVVSNLEFITLGTIANNRCIDLRVLGSRAL
jgi:hypothetical protein